MSNIKRAWNYLVAEPFWWIFLCFFQPGRLRRDIEMKDWQEFGKRIVAIIRLAIPILLTSYFLALLVSIIVALAQLSSYLDIDIQSLLFSTFMGIAFGITLGIAGGMAFGIAFGITFGVASSLGNSIAGGIVLDVVFGVALGIAVSTTRGGVALGNILSITISIILGIISSIAGGIILGIAFSIAFFIGFMVGLYRLPFYLVDSPSTLYAYFASQQKHSNTFRYLQHSSLHWDERIYLPLPFLKRTLLRAVEVNEKQAMEEIIFIIAERPQQARAARAAALEIIVRDLETRKSLKEIGKAWPYLTGLLPLEARPSGPGWSRLVQYLAAISTDAERYGKPIGQQERQKALADIQENLRKALPYVAFSDQRLNARLRYVIETWQARVHQEQERLAHAPQEIGKIDNPYKPGQALDPYDELFVGRRDLAELLSKELNKGSQRPTFLMNGERRMGKTTTLLQLPYLLGSHYIPVFYNLQDPGIYRSVATFLGVLGNKIFTEMHAKGMQVEPIDPRMLRDEYGQLQDTRAYSVFDHWLNSVETLLDQEESALLVNFDEFEKLAEADEAKHINLKLLLDWFRNIIQFHPRIALLFSGVHTFTEMGQETGINWSGAFVNVQALKVGFLKHDEAEKLVTKPTPEYPSEEIFGKGVVDKIIYDTGCHPFLIQAICSALIDNLNAERRQRAEISDVEVAIEQVLEGWDGYFGDLWIRTSEEQRACLKALLTLKCADTVQLQQQSGLDAPVLKRTLKTLLRRDLIAQEGEMYMIVAPIFVEWVARNV